jgi:hypothetical protein
MFKLTRGGNGLRRSSGRGGGQPSRVNWDGQTPIRATTGSPGPIKPPFVPVPQEQGYDTHSPRVKEAQ